MFYKRKNKPMPNLKSKWSRLLCASAISVLLVSCGGSAGDSDGAAGSGTNGTGGGGIIGTGIQLEGTASSVRKFASNNVDIKSRSGEKTTATIGNTGRFLATNVFGDGPYLLRADMGNNEYLYSIAHKNADSETVQNIHSYTDAAVRNWFASNGSDIDAAFAGDTPITALPDIEALTNIANGLLAIVNDVLLEYGLPNIDLTTVSYDANDTGVDSFLNNNPVLINNGLITILITDPDSRVITQASDGVALSTDFTIDDVVPPSAPTSLRALPATMTDIVVVWEPAIDNIGVTAYQVFRDGQLIATTPFPVYTDANLLADTQYSYTIVAIDSSGNLSVSSQAAASETLQLADTVAPPTPIEIELNPGLNTFGVKWSQEEVFDVAAFNVYRSGTAEQADAMFKVTSTFITDATVRSGSQYCYQVSAEDASGNESALSAKECAITSGSLINTPVTTPANNSFLAPTVDVSGISCNLTAPSSVSSDTVITAGCYLAPRGIRVSSAANLTIEPGVIIKFGSGTALDVNNSATLTAVGTASSPIVLSANEALPGYWRGLDIGQSNSLRNQLDFVQIEYAGGGTNRTASVFVGAFSTASRISIKNSTVRLGLGYGFRFDDGISLDAFEGNLITQTETPVYASVGTAHSLDDSNRYTGNTNDEVLLTADNVITAATLSKLDVPYRAAGRIDVKNSLTIEAGITMYFDIDEELLVSADGVLKVLGTAIDPILLTSSNATPGSWGGVRFLFGSNGANQIEHTTIEYAGGGDEEAALTLRSSNQSPSRLSASNVVLRESLHDGFRIQQGAMLPQFDNITSTLNGRAGSIAFNAAHQIGAGASFLGNVDDHIYVFTGSLEDDVTWLAHDVPYLVEDSIGSDHKLTLSAGTTLLMDTGAALKIGTDGALVAIGTAQSPIIITGKESIPGYWEGISFFRSHSPENRLEHVVEYGGGDFTAGKGGNITMSCVTSDPTRLSLENVALNFSRDWGISAAATDCDITIGDNVTYSGNGSGGFNLMP